VGRWLASKHFKQGRRLSLKCPRGFHELPNVCTELFKGRDFTAADFIPMPLVDSEQLDEEHHRVVFSQWRTTGRLTVASKPHSSPSSRASVT